MKYNKIFGLIITTIAGVSLGACTSPKASAPSTSSATVGEIKTYNAMVTPELTGNNSTDSGYVEYSPDKFNAVAGGRRVLFFYASWCPTCQAADANFKQEAAQIPQDVILMRVNYKDSDTDQQEKDLAKKYGITYQHTFVQIDSAGGEVSKWNGGQIDELLSNQK